MVDRGAVRQLTKNASDSKNAAQMDLDMGVKVAKNHGVIQPSIDESRGRIRYESKLRTRVRHIGVNITEGDLVLTRRGGFSLDLCGWTIQFHAA